MAEAKSDDNIKGALAYLLFFVSGIALLLVEKKSTYVRFHAMQSTLFFGGLFILGFIPVLGLLLWLILPFVVFLAWLFLMWKAFNGEKFKLPYVGNFAEKQLAKFK
ncbi:MAG: hypothetical protein UV59_C0012G0035 [Candidatus Gottesmanbacteria bacterium GW2011_GWA1_43_11]|uniref:DUF4870 domain-containing protein n=1 Tax=Candidatus Gottesmanbacteria bacterium GW2011_GWA1_43_11 TaxID=1618436 RepID=A0A0G1CHE6_9BACT|nr:MAG: hypothetical protein UV59_C0012G0035 [Candidatus Gottesmanbacteria bacterium GW2011_GWA1_43_11]